MRIRVAGLALPVVIGVTVAVTSCSSASTTASTAVSATSPASGATASSSPAASTAASSSAAASSAPVPVPTGYTRLGGAAQGISLGVPSSWTAVDLAKESAAVAASKVSTTGVSNASLVQDIQALQKLHAVAVWDLKSAESSPQHFARNLNAYCFHGAGIDVGAAGVPGLKAAVSSELGSQGAAGLTQQDLTIGGVPGVKTSYQVTSPTAGKLYGAQLEVVPKPDDTCVVTESFGTGQPAGDVLSVAAATAEFP